MYLGSVNQDDLHSLELLFVVNFFPFNRLLICSSKDLKASITQGERLVSLLFEFTSGGSLVMGHYSGCIHCIVYSRLKLKEMFGFLYCLLCALQGSPR